MPTQVDKLEKDSSDSAVQAAISDCIAYHVREGLTQEQAAGKCYGMARQKTGRELAPKGGK